MTIKDINTAHKAPFGYFTLSAIALAMLPVFSANADEFSYPVFKPSQSDFGGVGLMQMPTARMNPAGEFNFGATYNNEYHHYNASLQLFSWFEATIRYTLVQDLLYSDNPDFSGDSKYTDKGIDFKVRLWEESYWLPEVAVGVRDFGGTGLFDGEFIAANKQFGPVDVTLGVAWGYMGNSGNVTNPFCDLADRFCERETGGQWGTANFDNFFSGPMSIYGGLEYQSPWEPLRFKLEYDANDYESDFPVTRGDIEMPQDSKFNYGALYRLGNWGDLRLSYERGNTWTFGFNLYTNFNSLKSGWQDEPAPNYAPRSQSPSNEPELTDAEWQVLADELHTIAGYKNPTIHYDNESVTVSADQNKYRDRNEAHVRAATVLANRGPDVAEYRLIETSNHQAITETRIDAEKFSQVANVEYIGAAVEDSSSASVPNEPEGQLVAEPSRRWDVSLSPTLQQSIGGSEDFYMFNIGINAGANYWFTDNLELGGSVYFNIYDNYDQFLYDVPPDGTDLKRVRTLVRQYISDNPVRLDNLQLTWMDKLGDNWYSQAYGGYLEMMFGGVGGELLYRPLGANWAVGMDVNYVVQRDPDSAFGFFTEEDQFDPITNRPYRVQTGAMTGHFTGYYQPQWDWLPNTLFKVSAGQYLTEDIGVTVDFSKQFDSGITAGAFATFTDLSSDEYGEGSYTKGFYISIPFDVMTVKPSTNRATISWLPLTRDGGQMLSRKYQLFGVTDARSPWYSRKAEN
ncbi:YjbH domain-containing protein [Photobacterium satsumensis]|uniref:YjbH domain-containing protein n=1 Tax=Photobacterium satsumensis TaxID=2910239 RepID=UPI003D0E3E01